MTKEPKVGEPGYGIKDTKIKKEEDKILPKGPSWDDYMHPRKWLPRTPRLPSNTMTPEEKKVEEQWSLVQEQQSKKKKK